MTLAEQMALAILRGDRVAAYALADLLLEERDRSADAQAKAAIALRENHPTAHDGYAVYGWPEFQAFCRRAGILWDLRTVRMTIHINEGKMLQIEHVYAGSDADAPSGSVPVRQGAPFPVIDEESFMKD